MPTVLITGANRGIGLEFVRQYKHAGWDVIAAARQPSPELDGISVRVDLLDLANADAVAGFAEKISGPIDLFVANAGTSHPMDTAGADNARDWQAMMMVNVIAPFQLGQALLPRVAEVRGKMICISSGMGSIAENSGGWIPYRTSKAALNMAWSCLALEARRSGVTAVALSPGWVRTRMGGAGAEISTEESVASMRELIDRLTIDDTGSFLRRDGSELPW
jgi:NAD(P)-dependent dehydrogenase (short-subunit alcohol dehydrogenase family)